MNETQEWSRIEAEKRICEVLDSARTGVPQKILDVGGVFEIRFLTDEKETVGRFLSRGGPVSE